MDLVISAHLDYRLEGAADILLQIETAPLPDQHIVETRLTTGPTEHFARIPAEEDVGQRAWMRCTNRMDCFYDARVAVDRPVSDLRRLRQRPVHQLPAQTVKYLMASRYCPSDEFQSFVAAEFNHLSGGPKIAEMRDWIEDRFRYRPGTSTSFTTALDTFVSRQGICRDFAHVLVTLARASAIPARMVSVYAPEVRPPDFHAVAQVWLDGAWHLVDPTGMASADRMAIIGVGRDAADIAFMTSYGFAQMTAQKVEVRAEE